MPLHLGTRRKELNGPLLFQENWEVVRINRNILDVLEIKGHTRDKQEEPCSWKDAHRYQKKKKKKKIHSGFHKIKKI